WEVRSRRIVEIKSNLASFSIHILIEYHGLRHVNMQSYTDAETTIKYTGSKQRYSKHIADGINYNYNATEH
ncbi:hypothetical protein VIGAN_01133200, partial [Vigna angularis var. angularis]